jgi:hypothetical protein
MSADDTSEPSSGDGAPRASARRHRQVVAVAAVAALAGALLGGLLARFANATPAGGPATPRPSPTGRSRRS